MVKRGKLSNVEKFYIEGNSEASVEDIAKELDRSVNVVQKHLDSKGVPTKTVETEVVEESTKPKETRFLQQMGRHERAGQKVATVMTGAASEIADENRHIHTANKKIQEAIHRPRG